MTRDDVALIARVSADPEILADCDAALAGDLAALDRCRAIAARREVVVTVTAGRRFEQYRVDRLESALRALDPFTRTRVVARRAPLTPSRGEGKVSR